METFAIYLLSLVLLAVFWQVSVRTKDDAKNARRLAAIERKLQLVMDHLGVVEEERELPVVVRELEAGRKIQAIKAYREATGADLKEAKGAVEEIARSRGL